MPNSITIRKATVDDLDSLHRLETASFSTDRLTRRRLKHWINASNGILLVAEKEAEIVAYSLALLHGGTQLARLYSIAVDKKCRGEGVGKQLLTTLEAEASNKGRLFMRLEVESNNQPAIALYEQLGYVTFGTYNDYYEDHSDALRMQKRIRYLPGNLITHAVPWYQQTTDFTCGPAALMMGMAALNNKTKLTQSLELDIWREATTIFMTSGHGGSHPIGLALAAKKRGFNASVVINTTEPPFIEGVRGEEKKNILTVVHDSFVEQAKKEKIKIIYGDVTQKRIDKWVQDGAIVLILISTYRMNSRRTPHWVTVTAIDDECFYVHDPDPTEGEQNAVDCQFLPIARADFDKMSLFGGKRLRTAVVLKSTDRSLQTEIRTK